ncbi:cupin domain-containing protein [Oceanisphaera psychrotolerans]|uniref:XRE family transcriptional regulator n=1 Tax=Oceanisphaera psychrotolerans TaxID=1414654 RepID=A0A1J4QI81_9GAMM|nr:cupin domain-containing protein [Oceanisphaera psychrotolerans]OIN13140.1 XRE family transcriptional regulator [Oceanisphaera psychrotolerans]
MDIGHRLKSVRLQARLSQRELAKRSGVTNGFISQVEKNQVSPSIGSLKRLLDGLPMSLAEFFAEEQDNSNPVVYRADQQPDRGSGDISYRLIGSHFPGRTITLLRETMPPGTDTGPELLSHAGQECGVVIQGQLQLTVGDRCFELGPGDGYYFDSTEPHRFVNIGEQDLLIVSANQPPTY